MRYVLKTVPLFHGTLSLQALSCQNKLEDSLKLDDILIREDVTGDNKPDIMRFRKEREVIETFGATYIFEPGIYLAICEGEARSGEFLYDPREVPVYNYNSFIPSVETLRQESIELKDTNGDGIKDIVYRRAGWKEVITQQDTNGDGVMETV